MTNLFTSASFINSPIGIIPQDFPQLDKLCRAASIRYRDAKIDDEGTMYRTWSVVTDEKPAYSKNGRSTGNGTRKFHQFCMLLDFLAHQNPSFNSVQLYTTAMEPDATCKKLLAMPWPKMHDEMAKMSVNGYDTLRQKASKEDSLPEF